MKVYMEELTPEEIELNQKRVRIKAQLMGDNKAASEDGRFHCTYCQSVMSRTQIRLSHIVSPSQGGVTELKNMVLACPSCCKSKNGRSLADWSEHLNHQTAGVQTLIQLQARKKEKPAA